MNEKQDANNQTYQTGRTCPPKSYRGIIAFLLVLVIFLCGISTALGLMNIHLFRKLTVQLSGSEDTLSFSKADYNTTLPQAEPVCFTALGLSAETVSAFWQEYLGLPKGVYITDVTARAADAGLRPGDVLLQFCGAATESVQNLQALLESCANGLQAEAVIFRDAQQLTVTLTVENPS